jgi:hypothetical protein
MRSARNFIGPFVAAAALTVCACSGPMPVADASTTGPLTVPASSHVTGVYPGRCHSDGRHPDAVCTPGAVRADVTQANVGSTICRKGWTATVRPAASETAPVKRAAMRAYGEPAGASRTTELDHAVPIELGGANDVRNLWPQPSDEPGHGFSNSKDDVENALKAAVCSGRVPLVTAQQAITADWVTARARLRV